MAESFIFMSEEIKRSIISASLLKSIKESIEDNSLPRRGEGLHRLISIEHNLVVYVYACANRYMVGQRGDSFDVGDEETNSAVNTNWSSAVEDLEQSLAERSMVGDGQHKLTRGR